LRRALSPRQSGLRPYGLKLKALETVLDVGGMAKNFDPDIETL
jgi:hypothetical protein